MKPNNPLNLPDRQAAALREEVNRRKREQELLDIKLLMSTKEGRRICWRLLSITGVYRTSFTGNSETYFREGQRNVGLIIINDIQEAAPDDFVTMLKEHRSE